MGLDVPVIGGAVSSGLSSLTINGRRLHQGPHGNMRCSTYHNSDSHEERLKVQGKITPSSNQQAQQHRDFITAPQQTQKQLGTSTRMKKVIFTGGQALSMWTFVMTLFTVISGCLTAPLIDCPYPDYISHENGYCCRVVSCKSNFSVSMCEIEYGNDTCVQCPEDSFLLDPTTSERITPCVKPTCMKGVTKPSQKKSTELNPRACPQWCQCDVDAGYCGTDPCSCEKRKCQFGSVLQQDCGCRPHTPSPPIATTPKPIPVTTIKSIIPGFNISTTDAAPANRNTVSDISTSVVPSTNRSAVDKDEGFSVEVIYGIAGGIFFMLLIFAVYCCRRKKWNICQTNKDKGNATDQNTPNNIRSGNNDKEISGIDSLDSPRPNKESPAGATVNNISVHITGLENLQLGNGNTVKIRPTDIEEIEMTTRASIHGETSNANKETKIDQDSSLHDENLTEDAAETDVLLKGHIDTGKSCISDVSDAGERKIDQETLKKTIVSGNNTELKQQNGEAMKFTGF